MILRARVPWPRRGAALCVAVGLAVALSISTPAAEPPRPAIAVIVHPDVVGSDLALGELRRIFLADRQFWNRDTPITLLVPAAGSPERTAMLEKIYEKTETQYRHYWIAKVFRAEVASAPKVVSGRLAGDLVRGIEGAITVVEASRVPPGVKVLKIDGRRVEDGDYPLR